MLPVKWVYALSYDRNKSGPTKLVTALAKAPHESLFSSELVVTLVESFWHQYSSYVIKYAFIPFVAYIFVT